MSSLRLHLRVFTVLWLLCQTLSLAALVPADCCAAHHQAAASSSSECHQELAADAGACPMHTSAQAECPMHAGPAGEATTAACAMRALCNAPASALAMLIPLPGVLAVAAAIRHVEVSEPIVSTVPTSIDRTLAHDTPPPRA